MPSRRRQISAIAASELPESTENPGRAAEARSTNRSVASLGATSSGAVDADNASERSGRICSPCTARPSRLVARTRTSGHPRRTRSAKRAVTSRRCSQLSSTSRSCFVRRNSTMLASSDIPGRGVTPSAVASPGWPRLRRSPPRARRATRRRGSRRGRCAATCSASRVLPTPPVPVIVTNGRVRTAPAISTTASSRPMKDVTCNGRFPGTTSSEARRSNVVRQPRPRQLEDALGPREVAQTVLSQVDELQTVVERVAASSSVASETRICPPLAAPSVVRRD